MVPATTLRSGFENCLPCADCTFTKVTLKTDVDRSDSIDVKQKNLENCFLLLWIKRLRISQLLQLRGWVSEFSITTPMKGVI